MGALEQRRITRLGICIVKIATLSDAAAAMRRTTTHYERISSQRVHGPLENTNLRLHRGGEVEVAGEAVGPGADVSR